MKCNGSANTYNGVTHNSKLVSRITFIHIDLLIVVLEKALETCIKYKQKRKCLERLDKHK
ncbi:hypothetical protein ACFQ3N_16895 [Virgibacillus byunsanensis]|uniref:Uncharacterized protein n=1 Tax=Virgibacillus byunsanensis TaxID=570945 RepID=A0ABW3LNW4_9BACI